MTAPVAPPQPPQQHSGTPRPDRGPVIQRVLLGAGALCVLVAGGVYLAVSWHRIGTTGQTAFALVVTALAALAAHLLARRDLRASAETFAAVAAGLFALDLAGAHHLDVLGAAGMEWWLWLTVAGGAVLAMTAVLALVSRLVAYRIVAGTALAVLPLTGAVAADHAGIRAGSGAVTVLALAVGIGLVGLAVVIGRRDAATAIVAVLGASAWWLLAAVAGTAAAWSSRPLADVLPAAVGWAAVATVLLVLAGRAVAAGRTGDGRIVASVAGPIAAAPAALIVPVGAAHAFGVDGSGVLLVLTASWTAIAVALLVVATFVGPARTLLLVAGGTVGTLAALAGFAAQLLDPRSPALAVALLGLGAPLLVHGTVRTSRPVVLVAASALALATMDLALVARVDAVEAYTLPIAAVALVAGVLGRIGRPELSSWAFTAPAVLVAVVPSTAVALTDPGVARLVGTAVAAVAVAAAGLRFRLAAPLLLGAATAAVLALSQLAPYAVGAPRWVTLALAGVVLLALGVLFERARRGAAAAGRWYVGLR